MAVGPRKNKVLTTQSTTLLTFFTPGASSSKSTITSVAQKKKRRTPSVNVLPNPHEIIVIDSDEDDSSGPMLRKKRKTESKRERRAVDNSSDIEFVEHKTVAPSAEPSESYVPFGKPTSLLLDSSSSPKVSETPSQTLSPAPFGKPTVLLRSSKDNISLENEAGTSIEETFPEVFDIDDWDTGDDEVAQIVLDDVPEDEVREVAPDQPTTAIPSAEVSKSRSTPVPKSQRPVSSFDVIKTSPTPSNPQCRSTNSDLYSVLLSSRKENEAWKEAAVAEDRGFRPSKSNGGRRKAPFYKVLQGMPIAVDAFKYGTIPSVTAYFLTHAHSDHYTTLSSTWNSGPIYCSEGTANLIKHMLRVHPSWVHPLPMNVPTEIPNTGGVRVTLIEANHCPGSCLFFFEGKQTVDAGDSTFKSPYVGTTRTFRFLHCGDFRASPAHIEHPEVKGKKIDHVYLDTTYLDPKYTFPPQPLVISACAELAKRIQHGDSLLYPAQPGTMSAWVTTTSNADVKGKQKDTAKANNVLMIVGTYSIGKERIVKAIARALQSKIYCDSRKTAILRCQADPELESLLTKNPLDAQVHIVPLGHVNLDKLKEYSEKYKNHFKKVVGFRPTGWTYVQPAGTEQVPSIPTIISRAQRNTFTYTDLRQGRGSSSTLQVYPVPYSEHSSFFELTCFAMSFEWGKMIATVNVGSEASRGKIAKWVERWEKERKKLGKNYIVPSRKDDYW
ncbi:DNA repair metallo-beta-lactamase-domain-containing protein [Lentinula lateritia]|uniref:DNA repair metallo-beta-lactamase-domain-containing protein n=1 Tax=Lentinula lateritia TaxID=40482 RepID=A0ABQ8V8K0_9AGAR|nr:DNA repair metallo-beta-lactamase-domain-containing protein [Lentinula lateritia]